MKSLKDTINESLNVSEAKFPKAYADLKKQTLELVGYFNKFVDEKISLDDLKKAFLKTQPKRYQKEAAEAFDSADGNLFRLRETMLDIDGLMGNVESHLDDDNFEDAYDDLDDAIMRKIAKI